MKKKDENTEVSISRRKIIGEAPIVVNEITDRCLYSGFSGTLDSSRMKKIIDTILEVSQRAENDLMIIDLSNIEIIDSVIAAHLIRLNKTLQLVGLDVIFCGFQPVVAQSIVAAGVELDNITVLKNLKRAILEVYKRQGLKLVKEVV